MNFKLIWKAGKNGPIYMTIIYFILRGLIVPTYDSIQYYFLMQETQITKDQYDFLSVGQSIGVIIGTIIYMKWLMRYQVWKLIAFSIVLQMAHTSLLYANVMRWTKIWGYSDWTINFILMLFNQSIFTCLAVVPMTVKMMYVIPKNIEASMFAIITACLTFSSDWGGDMLGSVLSDQFHITSKDMTHYPEVILIKMGLLVLALLLCAILPSDQALKDLSLKLNPPEVEEEAEIASPKNTHQIAYLQKPSIPNDN